METVKVSSKGQIVIPKSVRDAEHIRTGDCFVVTAAEGELRFRRTAASSQVSLKSVAGMLRHARPGRLSEKEIERRILDEVRGLDDESKTR